MTKWKDTTAGGYKILWREEIKEGERKGWSFGEMQIGFSTVCCLWNHRGEEKDGFEYGYLVPAEPEITHSGWINVYANSTSSAFTSKKYATLGGVLGRIRIDWLDNGTYTVTKEEVCTK